MKPLWISAPDALFHLKDISNDVIGEREILIRARVGSLKAKAGLLNIDDHDSQTDVELDKQFWRRTPYSELEEHWNVGDFVAIHDELYHNAIGVSFDLAGLSAMLSAEQRPEFARRLSVAGNPAWFTALAAREFVYTKFGANPMKAAPILIERCRLGFVAARAVLRQQSDNDKSSHWDIEEREWDIPEWFWADFTAQGTSSQDWERGVFSGQGRGPLGRASIILSGIYFLRSSLEAMLPTSAVAKPVESVPAANPGGRPVAEFWDDLWCAIWGDIYRGDFKPKRQADVENAMLQWASEKHELSPSSAKPRARKLFEAYQSEGKNPPQ